MKKYVLFDLDGTLTASAPGVINGIRYALDKMREAPADESWAETCVGPPLSETFGNILGFPPEKIETAIGYYREYYRETGIFENTVYDGIQDLLETISDRVLIVATSKPRQSADTVLEYFNLKRYFTFVSASEYDGTRSDKDEVIAYALEMCNITDTSQAVMIGDHRYDILGAKKFGLTSVGCLYGYSTDLENADADYLVADAGELKELFIDGIL